MKKLLVLGFLFAPACGTDSSGPEILPELTIPPVPEHGIQVLTPIVEDIQPSSDEEICTWTDAVVTEQTDVKSTLTFQTEPPGHHALVFYTLDKLPPGTQRVCTDTDMASFRFLAGNGASGVLNEAPGNLVYRIPAGAQIVLQHHYLNSSDQVLRGQAVANLNFADPGGNYIPSGNTAILDTGIDVPEGESSHSIHCVMNQQMKLWYFAPHMHRWGKEITVDVTKSGDKQRLFDTIWDPSYTFHPPEKRSDPADPMILNPGDQIDVNCTWNNDTGRDLSFGFEMCVAFGEFVDDQGTGNIACNAGSWGDF